MMTKNLLKFCKLFAYITFLFCSLNSYSQVHEEKFLYIKSSEVNLRAGPEKRYPIKWIIKSKGEPMIVVAEFDGWVKVEDIDGDGGWVHNSMLTRSRHGILSGKAIQLLRSGPSETSRPIARLEPGIRFAVKKCISEEWCSISIDGLSGWIYKKNIWGLS